MGGMVYHLSILSIFLLEGLLEILRLEPSKLHFFKKDFIYLTQRERSQVGREAGREREREAGSLPSRKPDAGLDPLTLGS